MAIQQGAGYRDPTKTMTIKALQDRQKQAALAASKATEMPQQISDPWQAVSHVMGVAGAGFEEAQAGRQEAAARQQLSQIMAGIDPEKGATMEQIGQMQQYDPDFANKEYERMMAERAAVREREDTQQFQHGESELTRQHEDTSREDTQAATANENNLNRQADLARQKMQEAAANGRQDDQQAATEELARIQAQLDAEKAKQAEQIKVEGIGTESAAKVAEAKRLGLKEGTPEYQKFVFDINPSAATNITTNVGGGKKLDETLDTEEGKIWSGHQKERNVAAGSQKDMQMLSELVKQAPQGPIIGNLASLPILKGFSNAGVAFTSIVKRVAPTLRVEGTGSTSDLEYNGMLDSLPALGNHPEANALIIGMMQAKSAINIERGNVVDAYRNGQITDIQARQKLAEINQRSIKNPELDALMQRIASGEDTGGADAGGGSADVDAILQGIPK